MLKTREMSFFAETVWKQKYAQEGETWQDTATRVVTKVSDAHFPEYTQELIDAITARKFMPGGRYLYAAGRPNNQYNNCLLLDVEDSREGWAELMSKVVRALTTGAGVGVCYSKLRERGALVKGMGGQSTGPTALMQMVNETGRHIMQGGARRSALYASLHWDHPDVFEFIALKDWPDEVKRLKENDFNFPAKMDGTNISVILDDDFFSAYHNPDFTPPGWNERYETQTPRKMSAHEWAQTVYWQVVDHMLTTAEPGFQIDVGENAGEHMRNAPVAGETNVLTDSGYVQVKDIVGVPTTVWTGQQFASNVVFKETNGRANLLRVGMTGGRFIDCDPSHPFMVDGNRVAASDLTIGTAIDVSLPVQPVDSFDYEQYTLGWLYGDGSFGRKRADLTLCSDESKACAPWIVGAHSTNWNDGRGYIRMYFGVDDKWAGRNKRRVDQREITPSFVAGLFDADGNWNTSQRRIRLSSVHKSFLNDIRLGLEFMGIVSNISKAGISTFGKKQMYQLVVASGHMQRFASIIPCKRLRFDLEGYSSYRQNKIKVTSIEDAGVGPVYCADVGVPEHTFVAEGVVVSNCTELTSSDTDDICNLGSINLAQIETKEEFARLVEISTAFLISGTISSKVPYSEIARVREKNRRLGLGLMGIYEWLVMRGYTYDPNKELAEWLDEYAKSTEYAARQADKLGISRPVKTRAIAPTGTIGILAETTTGIEPLFATAYKRRYLKGQNWHYQYVIDATAQRMIDRGIEPVLLESAYDLANDPERRINFQAWIQQWVDHGISSTLNLPAPDKQTFSHRQFGDMLIRYLPKLRGVTAYPDGARGGQPLNVVPLAEAYGADGIEFEEFGNEKACVSGVCGV